MSGVLTGKTPANEAQWARDVEQRLKLLETKNTIRVGDWVLSSQNGNLQANRPGVGGSMIIDPDGNVLGSTAAGEPITAPTSANGPITLTQLLALFDPSNGAQNLDDLNAWLTEQWNKFLTPTSPLDWSNFFAQLPNWLTPTTLNIGQLTMQPVNLLADSGFNASLNAPSGRWTRDGTVYRTANWSVHIAANGVEGSIRSNLIKVTEGQEIAMSIHGAVAGLTGTGTLLELTALPFTVNADGDEIAGTPVSLGAIGIPGGSVSDWAAAPVGGHGFTLSGNWVVTAGYDAVALRITVHAGATAGDIWWDDGSYTFTGTLPPGAITGLVSDLETKQNAINAVLTAFATAGTPEAFQSAIDGLMALFDINKGTLQSPSPSVISTVWTDIITGQLIPPGLLGTASDISGLTTWLNQIGQIFNNEVVTPINSYVQQVKDWWNSILGPNAQAATVAGQGTTIAGHTTAISTNNTVLTQMGQIFNGQVVTAYNTEVQQLKDWWNSLTGGGASGTVTATAITGTLGSAQLSTSDWIKRAVADYTILWLDPFHTHWEQGSPTDTATTVGTNGLMTWYAAAADVKLLNATVGGTTPAVAATPLSTRIVAVEGAASTAQSTASGAASAASTAQSTASGAASAASTAQSTASGAASAASTAQGTATSAASAASAAQGTANTVSTAHQALTDAINQGVTPAAPANASAPIVNAAVASLQQSISGLTSQVVNLQSAAAGPTTVLRDDGKASPAANSLGSAWSASRASTLVNRDASYGFIWAAAAGTAPRLEIGIYNTPLATNDQVATIVLNSLMTYWPAWFYGGTDYQNGIPENWIIVRADSPTNPQNFVFAIVRYDDVQFAYMQAGTITKIGSPTSFKATAAASYSLAPGDAISDYNFTISSAGRVIASWSDTSHVTSFCVSNKYTGQAWKSDYVSAYGSEATPAATSWQAFDAAASAGTPPGYGHLYRASTTGVATTVGFVPYNFFDTTVKLGSGLSLPTSGNAGVIVGAAGVYAVSFGFRQASTANATDVLTKLAVNGTIIERGNYLTYDAGGTLLNGMQLNMASAGVLCNPGDLISPGIGGQSEDDTFFSLTLAGNSNGTHCFMKVMKVG